MLLQVAKYFAYFDVPSFYNKLHLADALFARTQTRSCGIGQTVYFNLINRHVSLKQIVDTTDMVHPFSN